MKVITKHEYIKAIIESPIRENPMRVMLMLNENNPASIVQITAYDDRWHHTSITQALKKLIEVDFVIEENYHGKNIYKPVFVCDFTTEEKNFIVKVIRHPKISANMLRILLALILGEATVAEIVERYSLTRQNIDTAAKKLVALNDLINVKTEYGVRVLSIKF